MLFPSSVSYFPVVDVNKNENTRKKNCWLLLNRKFNAVTTKCMYFILLSHC